MEQTLLSISATETERETPSLAGRYIQFCAVHLCELEEFITRHDLRAVSRIAHVLHGNAGQIGLSELSSLARQLEEYCLGSDWGAISSTYHAIAGTVLKLSEGKPIAIRPDFKPNGCAQEVHVKKAC